jgi:hypothetical protein
VHKVLAGPWAPSQPQGKHLLPQVMSSWPMVLNTINILVTLKALQLWSLSYIPHYCINIILNILT